MQLYYSWFNYLFVDLVNVLFQLLRKSVIVRPEQNSLCTFSGNFLRKYMKMKFSLIFARKFKNVDISLSLLQKKQNLPATCETNGPFQWKHSDDMRILCGMFSRIFREKKKFILRKFRENMWKTWLRHVRYLLHGRIERLYTKFLSYNLVTLYPVT